MTHDNTREVEVDGTIEEVWEAIATGDGIGAWFVPAEIEPREGGAATFHLGPGVDAPAVITTWAPPRRLAYEERWPTGEGEEPAALRTGFQIDKAGDGKCRVRVASIFNRDGFEDAYENLGRGWESAFDTLRIVRERFAGKTAQTETLAADLPGADKASTWDRVREAIDIDSLDGTLERETGEDLLIACDDALITLAVFSWSDAVVVSVRITAFDADPKQRAEGWQKWLDEHFSTEHGDGDREEEEATA